MRFGEIVDAVVMYEKEDPKKSRGFGFVTFTNMDGVRECLSAPKEEHQVHGVEVSVTVCKA